MNHDEAWPLLDPLLDGTLDPERRWLVAAHLGECPRCGAYLADQARLGAMVRARLRDVPTPPGLTERIRLHLAQAEGTAAPPVSRRPRQLILLLPAAAVLALFLVGAWWLVQARDDQSAPALDLAGELAATHTLFAHDDTLLEVAGDPAAVAAWFGDKVPFPVATPDVPGYELQGGRLVTVDGRPAAMVVYENEAAQQYVSLVTFAAPVGDLAGLTTSDVFATGTQGEVAVAIWSEGDLRHALVADGSQADVLRLATAVVDQS